MKRILVTGGAGRLGRLVIANLQEQGYDVLAVDCVRPATLQCRFLPAELTDAAAVYDVVRGVEGIIHLGAVPGPASQTQTRTFQNNVLSTFHVLEAAAALGVAKVVCASSVFALGWADDHQRYWPRYAPVDEDHPLTPFEAYGLSKQVGEELCATVSRRSGVPTVSLRIMNVIQPEGYQGFPWPAPTQALGVRFVMWPYVDARDAARACRLALEAPTAGHEALYIAATETRFSRPTLDLLREHARADLEIRGPLDGTASVISIDKARRVIGFEPQYTWRTQVPASSNY